MWHEFYQDAERSGGERVLDTPVRPTNLATMMRAKHPADPGAGLEVVACRWWLVPYFHRGPVTDWKSMSTTVAIETLDTAPPFRQAYAHRRALIPVTRFIGYDEPQGWKKGQPKRRWEVTWVPQDEGDVVRYFAGIWDRATPSDMDGPLDSFAIVTGSAGADISAIGNHQPVVMSLEQGLGWLDLGGPGKAGLDTQTPVGTYSLTEKPREALMSRDLRRAI